MISFWLLVPAFILGLIVGILLAACCFVAGGGAAGHNDIPPREK